MNRFSEKRKLLALIKDSKRSVILSHYNPDADAVGSSLALFFLLKKMKKKVQVILPNTFPEFLNWMPSAKKILIFEKDRQSAETILNKADLIFLLDCNSFNRLNTELNTEGLAKIALQSGASKILIDHHKLPENYFDAYFFDDRASSTCELIYKLTEYLKVKNYVDKKVAQCIYTGIMTDTGSFKYSSVSSYTMKIVADLLEYKIDHPRVQRNVFDTYSYDRLKLLGFALSEKLKYLPDYNSAYITLSQKDLENFNYKKGDTEGFVNFPLSIKSVVLSALFTETDKTIRVSLRSKGNIDVSEIARKYFNGGGHKNASGGQMNVSLEAVAQLFEKIVKEIKLS